MWNRQTGTALVISRSWAELIEIEAFEAFRRILVIQFLPKLMPRYAKMSCAFGYENSVHF